MKNHLIEKYLHPISVIQQRIQKKQLWSLGFFIAVSVSLVSASLILINEFRYLELNIIIVERQILSTPILIMCLLISLYLGISASVNLSREYDRGTLELLLYGPVDEVVFIFSNFWAEFQLFYWSAIGVFVWSNFIVWLYNLAFDLNVLLILLGCGLMAAEIIAFGLLTAVWGGKTRNALVVYILILAVMAGIQIGDTIVANLVLFSGSTATDPLIVLRNVLEKANGIFRWISPYAQLQKAIQALLDGIWPEFTLMLGMMLLEAGILLFLSIRLLVRKGVRPSS
jgi:hypothetical protein